MRIDLTAALVVPIGILQQLRTNWPSDRKPVEGCGFRVFQHPSAPPLARDIAECRVIVRCPMDGRRASRTIVGLYELIFFSFLLVLWIASTVVPFTSLCLARSLSFSSIRRSCFALTQLVHLLLHASSISPCLIAQEFSPFNA